MIVRRRGRDVAALVPLDDLERLEDLEDIEAARAALAEPGPNIPYEAIRKEAGLK